MNRANKFCMESAVHSKSFKRCHLNEKKKQIPKLGEKYNPHNCGSCFNCDSTMKNPPPVTSQSNCLKSAACYVCRLQCLKQSFTDYVKRRTVILFVNKLSQNVQVCLFICCILNWQNIWSLFCPCNSVDLVRGFRLLLQCLLLTYVQTWTKFQREEGGNGNTVDEGLVWKWLTREACNKDLETHFHFYSHKPKTLSSVFGANLENYLDHG